MVSNRVWDSCCPLEWERWEANGKTWIIQDIAPEDDDRALDIMVQHFLPDEVLCSSSNLANEPESVKSICEVWRNYLIQRTSLGCYTEVDGKKTLVALNICYVACKGVDEILKIDGERCKNVFGALDYIKSKCDPFGHLGVDKVLSGLGLSVMRDYRGAELGGRLLAAREPLCRFLGVKATETIFTGPASQTLATRSGFYTLLQVSLKDLAEVGLKYPKEDRLIKVMVKKY